MADHTLQQIRQRLQTILTGAAGIQSVHLARKTPLRPEQLPAANVLSASESIDYNTVHAPGMQWRTGTVEVQLIAASAGDVESLLLAAQLGVEVAVAADQTLNGLVYGIELKSSRPDEQEDDDAEKHIDRRILTFEFSVATAPNAPDVPL